MTRHLKLSLHVLLMVMTILSCGQFVQPPATPTPGNILERTNTLAARLTSGSTDTTAAPGLTPSAALPTDRPRTPTRTLPPTATYPPVDPGPFRRVTSLAEPFPNLFEEVQVRAPADGTVWVITSRTIARWDGQAWNLVRSMEEDMLADVDENGRL
jgi:hypothetical protein